VAAVEIQNFLMMKKKDKNDPKFLKCKIESKRV
jgi:hypothetical protein